ncbi:MAG: hypothetical protein AAB539_01500 [Patescibacteria group bacterium]
MKTIFIPINRGIIVRNLLRNRFFEMLAGNPDIRTILLFAVIEGRRPPEYLKKEFERENVVVEFVPNIVSRGIRRRFGAATGRAIFSPTTKLYARYGTTKVSPKTAATNSFWYALYPVLAHTRISRSLVWSAEAFLFPDRCYDSYFVRYRPDLVFSTAILSVFDLAFLKGARRREIATVSMPKSWDNLDKNLFRFEPDVFAVQNEWMAGEAVEYQKFNPEKIRTVGFPQFDIYRDPGVLISREQYCAKKDFDPSRPLIFVGSEGEWSRGDDALVRRLVQAEEHGAIPVSNILIRPHFSGNDGRFDSLKNTPGVFVDDTYRTSDFFIDHWDPTRQDMADFTNTLYHSDVSINFASTLSLDAVCFDKPIINIGYGARWRERPDGAKEDMTWLMYETNYYRAVMATNATTLVKSDAELLSAIRMSLRDPAFKRAERNLLRDKMCYNVDCKSGERLYELVTAML